MYCIFLGYPYSDKVWVQNQIINIEKNRLPPPKRLKEGGGGSEIFFTPFRENVS